MDSFVLYGFTYLGALRTLLQRIVTCLNFTLDSEIYSVGTNQKSCFCGLRQQ